MIKIHDVVEHLLSLDSRTLRVELYRLQIAIDCLLPVTLLPISIALLIILLGGSELFTSHYELKTMNYEL